MFRRTRRRRVAGAALAAGMMLAPGISSGQSVDAAALQDASAKATGAVDVAADSMELLQDANKVIFTGNVDAVRGSVRLRSDKLVVEYQEVRKGDSTERSPKQLDAEGRVEVVSGRQVIRSHWAKMDVDANVVTMGGDVVVTQGDTVLRGEQLAIDLNTGKSELSGGRVRGRFVPE